MPSDPSPASRPAGLRVAFVAGGLGQGGAEKQLFYMARALVGRGVDARCYCLTRGDHHEQAFRAIGLDPVWVGRHSAPPLRLARLGRLLRAYRPDVVQAGHFFANLYAALGARVCGAASIGAVRNDGVFELKENRGWGPLLMRLPTVMMANSHAGADEARRHRSSPHGVVVMPNVIDLQQFDATTTDLDLRRSGGTVALAVGRLVPAKRFDRFLSAIAIARRTVPTLSGVIIGSGTELGRLEGLRQALGLEATAAQFLGARSDTAALMRQADFLVSSSDHEGFPNVLLEAMAARLPVITTPAGDAAQIVVPGVTGVVVPADDVNRLAAEMVALATHADQRQRMAVAARSRVERVYAGEDLADRLIDVYGRARARVKEGGAPTGRERRAKAVATTP